MPPEAAPDRFLAWRQVRDLTGLGRTTAWRLRRHGDFPEPVTLSPGRVAWRERDIAAWNASRGSRPESDEPASTSDAPPTASSSPAADRPEARQAVSLPARTPATPSAASSSADPPARTSPSRRRGAPIAAGQLGFDF